MVDENTLFNGKATNVIDIYENIINHMKSIGEFEIQIKKTCIHFVNNSAFIGIHPKKNWLDVTIVSLMPLNHSKIIKVERVSKNRVHNDFRLHCVEDIDIDFILFIKDAYLLKSK